VEERHWIFFPPNLLLIKLPTYLGHLTINGTGTTRKVSSMWKYVHACVVLRYRYRYNTQSFYVWKYLVLMIIWPLTTSINQYGFLTRINTKVGKRVFCTLFPPETIITIVMQFNTLRTGSFKLSKRPFPGFLTILTL